MRIKNYFTSWSSKMFINNILRKLGNKGWQHVWTYPNDLRNLLLFHLCCLNTKSSNFDITYCTVLIFIGLTWGITTHRLCNGWYTKIYWGFTEVMYKTQCALLHKVRLTKDDMSLWSSKFYMPQLWAIIKS